MVTFWAILKNITLEVKTAVATFWASLCKNLGNILFQHLVALVLIKKMILLLTMN